MCVCALYWEEKNTKKKKDSHFGRGKKNSKKTKLNYCMLDWSAN